MATENTRIHDQDGWPLCCCSISIPLTFSQSNTIKWNLLGGGGGLGGKEFIKKIILGKAKKQGYGLGGLAANKKVKCAPPPPPPQNMNKN